MTCTFMAIYDRKQMHYTSLLITFQTTHLLENHKCNYLLCIRINQDFSSVRKLKFLESSQQCFSFLILLKCILHYNLQAVSIRSITGGTVDSMRLMKMFIERKVDGYPPANALLKTDNSITHKMIATVKKNHRQYTNKKQMKYLIKNQRHCYHFKNVLKHSTIISSKGSIHSMCCPLYRKFVYFLYMIMVFEKKSKQLYNNTLQWQVYYD